MGEKNGFKTSFRGFAKEDVLAYIDDLRLQLQAEQEARREETEALKSQLEQAQAQLADAPLAAEREEQLRTALAESEETVNALRQQVEALTTDLTVTQAQLDTGREQELTDALAEVRAELSTARERENELTAQLAETHQAVAKLWQEKEGVERKLTVALEYADRQQQAALEFKQQLGADVPPAEESGSKPMERWLF